jgi:hypothetical protein
MSGQFDPSIKQVRYDLRRTDILVIASEAKQSTNKVGAGSWIASLRSQ